MHWLLQSIAKSAKHHNNKINILNCHQVFRNVENQQATVQFCCILLQRGSEINQNWKKCQFVKNLSVISLDRMHTMCYISEATGAKILLSSNFLQLFIRQNKSQNKLISIVRASGQSTLKIAPFVKLDRKVHYELNNYYHCRENKYLFVTCKTYGIGIKKPRMLSFTSRFIIFLTISLLNFVFWFPLTTLEATGVLVLKFAGLACELLGVWINDFLGALERGVTACREESFFTTGDAAPIEESKLGIKSPHILSFLRFLLLGVTAGDSSSTTGATFLVRGNFVVLLQNEHINIWKWKKILQTQKNILFCKHKFCIYINTQNCLCFTKNVNDHDNNYHIVCFACITLQLLQ